MDELSDFKLSATGRLLGKRNPNWKDSDYKNYLNGVHNFYKDSMVYDGTKLHKLKRVGEM